MDTSDKVLLALLLIAVVAFPVAIFLYLRTEYKDGGWPKVKLAAIVAVVSMLIPGALKIWVDWEFHNVERIIKHPLTLGSVVLFLVMWLVHCVLKTPVEETHDQH